MRSKAHILAWFVALGTLAGIVSPSLADSLLGCCACSCAGSAVQCNDNTTQPDCQSMCTGDNCAVETFQGNTSCTEVTVCQASGGQSQMAPAASALSLAVLLGTLGVFGYRRLLTRGI